jgi:hypothetical protein
VNDIPIKNKSIPKDFGDYLLSIFGWKNVEVERAGIFLGLWAFASAIWLRSTNFTLSCDNPLFLLRGRCTQSEVRVCPEWRGLAEN